MNVYGFELPTDILKIIAFDATGILTPCAAADLSKDDETCLKFGIKIKCDVNEMVILNDLNQCYSSDNKPVQCGLCHAYYCYHCSTGATAVSTNKSDYVTHSQNIQNQSETPCPMIVLKKCSNCPKMNICYQCVITCKRQKKEHHTCSTKKIDICKDCAKVSTDIFECDCGNYFHADCAWWQTCTQCHNQFCDDYNEGCRIDDFCAECHEIVCKYCEICDGCEQFAGCCRYHLEIHNGNCDTCGRLCKFCWECYDTRQAMHTRTCAACRRRRFRHQSLYDDDFNDDQ